MIMFRTTTVVMSLQRKLISFVFLVVLGAVVDSSTAFSFIETTTTRSFCRPTVVPLRKVHHCPSSLAAKDWDAILSDDEDDGPPVSQDMKYIPRNCIRQNQHFMAIREAAGKELTNDVYARDPQLDTFWYVGKIARISDVSIEQAIARQWNLIETHASNLRPNELFSCRGLMELWTAPGDSEIEVAYNRPSTVFAKMERIGVEGADTVKNSLIGFQGELYDRGEDGFRTLRLPDGRPAKPEIMSPAEEEEEEDEEEEGVETRGPTDEEMENIQKTLERIEEQQRRMEQE
jgi:hypothetical protein